MNMNRKRETMSLTERNLSNGMTNAHGYANHLLCFLPMKRQKACEAPHSRCKLFLTLSIHCVIEPTVTVTYITESPSLSPSSHSPSCMSALFWVIETLNLSVWKRSSMQRMRFHSEAQSKMNYFIKRITSVASAGARETKQYSVTPV